jgi:RNA polymerase sigma factor (TIGR02999 family)
VGSDGDGQDHEEEPLGGADEPAQDRLERLYGEVRRVAGRLFEREASGHTLQPTAVAHEAWIRLADRMPPAGDGPDLPLIVRAVRNVLVDHARRRTALRRGGTHARVHLEPDDLAVREDPEAMVIVGEALDALAERSQRAATVVELRFIAGCSEDEVAVLLGCSRATVARDWKAARMWLRRALDADASGAGA